MWCTRESKRPFLGMFEETCIRVKFWGKMHLPQDSDGNIVEV